MAWRVVLSGATAGVVTAVAFAYLHELLISDIWFSVVPMMIAGALCGGTLAWTYHLLFPAASGTTWSSFVGLQIALLLTLGDRVCRNVRSGHSNGRPHRRKRAS